MVKVHTGTSLLGRAVEAPRTPDEATLDRVANPHRGENYIARFTAPEFTALCPVTGQPDFALLVIDYLPGGWLVESKSLKLYLTSFRNHGAFHEDCTLRIGKDLALCLEPRWLRIGGYWFPRGGIPIDVFWATGELPDRHLGARSRRAALSRKGIGRASHQPRLLDRGGDKTREQRVRLERPRFEFGMKLHADEPRDDRKIRSSPATGRPATCRRRRDLFGRAFRGRRC